MKKCLTFVVILGLGLFCAVGCNKPANHPGPKPQPPKVHKQNTEKPGPAIQKPQEKPGDKK